LLWSFEGDVRAWLAADVAKAAAKEVRAIAQGTPEDEVQRRLNICGDCPHLSASLDRCNLCKCILNYKNRLHTSSCPAGYW
jgi:hypothetical protein